MSGKARKNIFFYLVISVLLSLGVSVYAQPHKPVLDKKYSFNFANTTLASAFNTISAKTGRKFSYNPVSIGDGHKVTMNFKNVPLREIIRQLINDPEITVREIGNQIVVYRGDPSLLPLEANQQIIPGKQTIVQLKKIPDTVFVYNLDTLLIKKIDTLIKTFTTINHDTIRLTDTVFVKPVLPEAKKKFNFKDLLYQNEKDTANGLYAGIYMSIMVGKASFSEASSTSLDYVNIMEQANSENLFKYSYGIVAGYNFKKIGIESGLGFTRLGEQFNYRATIETGGYYKTDTIESYYTVNGNEVTWFYITDSTWIPKNTVNNTFKKSNIYRYIDVPLSLKYRFFQNPSTEMFVIGGIKASVLVSSEALYIAPDDYNAVLQTERSLLNPVLFSWHIGVGGSYRFTGHTGLLAEIAFNKQMNSQFEDSVINKYYNFMDFKLGAFIKF